MTDKQVTILCIGALEGSVLVADAVAMNPALLAVPADWLLVGVAITVPVMLAEAWHRIWFHW